jgi:signal transduction histidine kinase
MFTPFAQGDADKSGLGLGLSIARRSVEANGGRLSVRNVPGCGCVFTLELPRHSLEAPYAAVPAD